MSVTRQQLKNWHWQNSHDVSLQGATEVPTVIHLDLLAAGHIPGPLVAENEADLQWIHNETWIYRTKFEAAAVLDNECVDLVFDGLDTFATVKLNGQEILRSTNMFVSHRTDVKHLMRAENELEITFESAYIKSEQLRQEKGHLLCWNGHYGRVYVRKAQYHFGWDWGPSLITCGPWKPVTLERYVARIEELRTHVDLSECLQAATLTVSVAVEPFTSTHGVEIELHGPNGGIMEKREIQGASTTFQIKNPELWYPHAHGKQPLYSVKAVLRSAARPLIDSKMQTVGFRRVKLIQSPLEEGSSFYFTVNDIPIFMGGSNWIPGDMFLPRMTPARYQHLLDLAIRGNQNMIRVWGGGIYEDDAFYDECDRRGLLVWQDFCFACGQYPWDDEFVKSVEAEATQAIKRLRGHPSLVIWAGNNEDYQIANEGLSHDMTMPEEQWLSSTFGARHTYERTLPDLVKQHSPETIYWPGSPFGGVDNNSDRTVGDVHIWNVSSGMLLPYQRYPDITGRFVSEFGMLSCPAEETVAEGFFGDSDDKHPQSRAFEHHVKASSYEKRMFTCMGENFRLSFKLDEYIYLTQLLQSEAMYYAYRGWRRQFEDRTCGGALVWQTNDVWPAVSWSIIDYYGRPKMAYYAISRAMKPLATGVARRMKINARPNLQHEAYCNGKTKADAANVIAHATPHIYPPRESTYAAWIVNSAVEATTVKFRFRFISIRTGVEMRQAVERTVEVKPTGTTEVLHGKAPEEEPTVLVSEIFDVNGTLVAHDVDWPQPLKHLKFPDRGVKVKVDGHDLKTLTVTTERPVKGLFFTNDGVEWSENGIDVAPGQTVMIEARMLKDEPRYRYYGME